MEVYDTFVIINYLVPVILYFQVLVCLQIIFILMTTIKYNYM